MINVDWENWVHRLHWAGVDECVSTIEWIYALCMDGILPLLHKRGYKLVCSPFEFYNSVLNYSYRIYLETLYGRYSTYKSTYEKSAKYNIEDLEFFEDIKFTDDTMNMLKNRYAIDYLADDSSFSNRFWAVLRYIIFVHLDLNKSPASLELYDLLNPPEDDDCDSEKRPIAQQQQHLSEVYDKHGS